MFACAAIALAVVAVPVGAAEQQAGIAKKCKKKAKKKCKKKRPASLPISPPAIPPATPAPAPDLTDDLPSAVGDFATIGEDSPATAVDVLANDVDPDGGVKTIMSKTNGSKGTVVITGGGSGLTYTPNIDYCGPDIFSYTLNGGSTAMVGISVACVDDGPIAADDSVTVQMNTTSNSITGLLANDFDPDSSLSISAVEPAMFGTVSLSGGTPLYTPPPGYCGTDTFNYRVGDGTLTDTATVTVSVNCAPIASDDPAGTSEDTPLLISTSTLMANDSDFEGNPLSVVAVQNAINGSVFLSGNTVTFTPASNFCGQAQFDYLVSDGNLTDVGTVTVTVSCLNDGPVAANDAATVAINSTNNPIPNLLANDIDPEGDAISIVAVYSPTNGSVVLSGGTPQFTPNAGYCGPAGFEYVVSDGSQSDSGHVTVTVTC